MAEQQLRALVTKRGMLKGQLTRFEQFIDNIDNSPTQLVELQKRANKLDSIWDNFNNIQAEIQVLDNKPEHNTETEDFENKYFKLTALAETKIKASQAPKVGSDTPTGQDKSNPRSNPDSDNTLNIKLPDIKLPEFTGSYDNWVQFYDTFKALIDENAKLTTIQKFYYLQSALKGDAAQSLKNLEITEANYPVAWELLKERYQNKKIIIHSHMKNLFELPNVTKDSHTSLRQLLDAFIRHFRALENLGQPVTTWDTILIFLLSSKLDIASKREWELATKNEPSPGIQDFTKFLHNRCLLLETLNSKVVTNQINSNPKKDYKSYSHVTSVTAPNCIYCNENHYIFSCNKFLTLTPNIRFQHIKALNVCINCFRAGHSSSSCERGTCKTCRKRHNTLLHFENKSQSNQTPRAVPRTNNNEISYAQNNTMNQNSNIAATSQSSAVMQSNMEQASSNDTLASTTLAHYSDFNQNYILLSTAIVYVLDSKGNSIKCRALLDSGSQSNFMTRNFFNKLNLKANKLNITVSGINQISSPISDKAHCVIKSTHNNFTIDLSFLIIDHITENIPQISIDYNSLEIPSELSLADPEFYISNPVDVLLGANIFWTLLRAGQIKSNKCNPILHNTVLGWIVSGKIPHVPKQQTICNLITSPGISNAQLSEQLEKFWIIENTYSSQVHYTEEEQNCETHFVDNFFRDETGRFTVSLPFRENRILGESKEQAIKRFYAVERKLQKHPSLYTQYRDFMNEYQTLNHMKEISDSLDDGYYLPHHSVLKADSLTTKLRVVFDASAKTTNNYSLNDVLMVGPCIQDSLISILTRFRKHNVALIADVAKMYRQILVNETDRKYQRIVWRDNANAELKHYELQTVTYGTAPASFLATRCLQQVATENEAEYPLVHDVIRNDFYMDDLLTGVSNIDDAINLKQDLEHVLSSAGFLLRKWISNSQEVFQNSDNTDKNYIISDDEKIKTLGMSWSSKDDMFYFSLNHNVQQFGITLTKRVVLSTVARIYDPLGLISCVIVTAKCMLQTLWKNNLGWDDGLPPDLEKSWALFFSQLPMLNELKIPRQITCKNMVNTQLHGYCDSSEIAYGAALYLRTTNDSGEISIKLICTKSRVAPVKTVTLPKLELCGAVLLAKLAKETIISLKLNIQDVFYWCDSSIVLSWISAHPSNWKTFVCNRVSEIQQLTDKSQWRHVPSAQNPADIITRGCSPADLVENTFWWHGPSYLLKPETDWPQNIITKSNDIPEVKNKNVINLNTTSSRDIFELFSEFTTLQRAVAYCLRFLRHIKQRDKKYPDNLTVDELTEATLKLVKMAQISEFSSDIRSLKQTKRVSNKSKLISLNSFLDDNEVIRVGGRLAHSQLTFEQKHPVVLPSNHALTKLLIRHEHIKNLHGGLQVTLSSLRRQYWPLRGAQAVKGVLRKCVTCFKAKPRTLYPRMSDLPSYRVTPSPTFHAVGTDFAGPYLVKDGTLKNRKMVKSYFCIFICLATKAVHLEPVGDLSTNGFLKAFKRFTARRGMCKHIYSDNATNYVGSQNELNHIINLNEDKAFQSFLGANHIEWHFIPARSPHFGGIWEAAVKSSKYHLKRIMNNLHFTYEEFHTLLAQVEAVLNSRPLIPLTNDPSDLEALTPGHFLIGRALTSLPQENLEDVKFSRLTRFQHLQQMLQQFWSRWSKDYLNTLQTRTKWQFNSKETVPIGALVMLKEDNLPPQQWRLGRILEVFPGTDGVVRVVSIKTKHGVVKRAVTRICILPIDDDI